MVAAFFGGWGAAALLTRIAQRGGQTDIARLLLAGVALSALVGAITGLLITMAKRHSSFVTCPIGQWVRWAALPGKRLRWRF